jgi:hypothetical protein
MQPGAAGTLQQAQEQQQSRRVLQDVLLYILEHLN